MGNFRPQRLPKMYSQIMVAVVYHPPGSDDRMMSEHIIPCVESVLRRYFQSIIFVCGNFNLLKEHLKSACRLKQIVTKPTRGRATLDICYPNMTDLYQDLRPISLLVCKPSVVQHKEHQQYTTTTRSQGPREPL